MRSLYFKRSTEPSSLTKYSRSISPHPPPPPLKRINTTPRMCVMSFKVENLRRRTSLKLHFFFFYWPRRKRRANWIILKTIDLSAYGSAWRVSSLVKQPHLARSICTATLLPCQLQPLWPAGIIYLLQIQNLPVTLTSIG